MKQPIGFLHSDFPNHICCLRKAIYGLKQAPQAWYLRFSSFLLQQGFFCCQLDTSMFIFRRGKYILYVILYVDDIIVTGNSAHLITKFISRMSAEFAMKDLGPLHYFLGVQTIRTSHGLFLCRNKYVHDLLLKFNMHTIKPVRTPLLSITTLSLTNGDLLSDPTK